MAEGFDTEQANSGPSTPVRLGETHGDAIQQSYTDLDKIGHTKDFSDVLDLSAPNFMRCRYASEKPTDHISSDEKKVHFILPDIGLTGTAPVLIYAVDIDKNALHPVKLVGDNCEKDIYYKTMKLQPGKKIDLKIGLLPVLPTNKDIPKNIEARRKYLREMSKETLPENSSRKANKNLFCLKVEVQCPNGMTLVGYSNPVRDGKDGMEFKVYKYCEEPSKIGGLVIMTKNSNFDDNIEDVVVLLKKKGSAENEKPIEVFKPLEIEKQAITIKPISAYIKERYPESKWCLFQIQVKDCVTGLKTAPHDLYGATVSSASPCTPAKKIKTEHGTSKKRKYKGPPCSDQAKKAILQKMMCKSDAVKSQSASEQVESSADQQLALPTNITNQPPKYHPGMQNIPIFHHQSDLRSSASQMEASAGSLKTLRTVKKKRAIPKGIEEKREHVDISQDKICTSVAGHLNNAVIIPVSNTSEAIRDNMVQTKNLLVTSFSDSLVCGRDTSSWELELMQLNGSQTNPWAQYDLEDYPMQQDTCQNPDQAMDAYDDDDNVVQQDSGQKPNDTIDAHDDDKLQLDSGYYPNQALDGQEDDVLQLYSSQQANETLDTHEDDTVQLDSDQNQNQAVDANEDDASQLNSGQNPNQTIDIHEYDAVQLNSGPIPNLGFDANEDDAMQQDDEMVATINDLIFDLMK